MPTREDVLNAYVVLLSAVDIEESKVKIDKNGKDWKISFSMPIDDVTMVAQITNEIVKEIERQKGDWRPDMFEDNSR